MSKKYLSDRKKKSLFVQVFLFSKNKILEVKHRGEVRRIFATPFSIGKISFKKSLLLVARSKIIIFNIIYKRVQQKNEPPLKSFFLITFRKIVSVLSKYDQSICLAILRRLEVLFCMLRHPTNFWGS